jgi:hypothetical protein
VNDALIPPTTILVNDNPRAADSSSGLGTSWEDVHAAVQLALAAVQDAASEVDAAIDAVEEAKAAADALNDSETSSDLDATASALADAKSAIECVEPDIESILETKEELIELLLARPCGAGPP